jgi:hypothetical protein
MPMLPAPAGIGRPGGGQRGSMPGPAGMIGITSPEWPARRSAPCLAARAAGERRIVDPRWPGFRPRDPRLPPSITGPRQWSAPISRGTGAGAAQGPGSRPAGSRGRSRAPRPGRPRSRPLRPSGRARANARVPEIERGAAGDDPGSGSGSTPCPRPRSAPAAPGYPAAPAACRPAAGCAACRLDRAAPASDAPSAGPIGPGEPLWHPGEPPRGSRDRNRTVAPVRGSQPRLTARGRRATPGGRGAAAPDMAHRPRPRTWLTGDRPGKAVAGEDAGGES